MKPWQILSSRVLIDRLPWMRVTEQDVRLPTGYVLQGYLLADTREFSMTFALAEDGRVPFVPQYKHGALRRD